MIVDSSGQIASKTAHDHALAPGAGAGGAGSREPGAGSRGPEPWTVPGAGDPARSDETVNLGRVGH